MKKLFIYRIFGILLFIGIMVSCFEEPDSAEPVGSSNLQGGKTDSITEEDPLLPCGGIEATAEKLCSCLSSSIGDMVCDGTITDAEWETAYNKALKDAPKIASDSTKAVLLLWASPNISVENKAREGMRSYLRYRGYNIPDSVPQPVTSEWIAKIISDNISEPDRVFNQIYSIVNSQETSLLMGIVDGGFDVTHPALQSSFWINPDEIAGNNLDDDGNGKIDDINGWSFHSKNGNISTADFDSTSGVAHGTHVAGIATKGTNWIKLIGVQLLNIAYAGEALTYVAEQGSRVVNLSMGIWEEYVVPTLAAIDAFPDVLFIHSAGNYGSEVGIGGFAPDKDLSANLRSNLIHVAAADENGNPMPKTNYSSQYIAVAARAEFYSSSTFEEGYVYTGQTSQATPNVANLAAKCLLIAPHLTPAQVISLLVKTCDEKEVWKSKVISGGLINAKRALQLAALLQFIHNGKTADQAVILLALSADEKDRLLSLVNEFE